MSRVRGQLQRQTMEGGFNTQTDWDPEALRVGLQAYSPYAGAGVRMGVAIGLVAALGLTRVMSSLSYGVETTDPLTFGVLASMLVAVALVASYVPALRASRTDPLEALRFE